MRTIRPDAGESGLHARPSWRRGAATGAVLVSLLSIVSMVLAGELIPPLLVMAVLFAGTAAALWGRSSRWALYVGIGLPVLAFLGSIRFVVADLSHPESIAGFVPQLLLTLAVLFTAVASGAQLAGSGPRVRSVAVGFGALAVGGLLTSVAATAGLSDDERREGDLFVVAEDTEFPAEITTSRGELGLFLQNADPIRHTFVIEGTDVHQEMPGSTSRRAEVVLEPGTYRYFCDVPGHDGMEGTLSVT